MAAKRILIIDDDHEIQDILSRYLKREGFKIATADKGTLALDLVHSLKPHLIILDILLPDINGIELCKKIRNISTIPILFLSCKDDASDKVLGLGIGGDDYITKPFSPSEVVARVKAHLRRNELLKDSHHKKQTISFPGLEINTASYTVLINNKTLTLPAKEFKILAILAENPNQIFNTEQLFDLVWKEETTGDLRTVAVHISSLRKKIEPDPANPKYIRTVRGVGYKFAPIY